MNEQILKFLKDNGEQLDVDIARALRMPVAQVNSQVAKLAAAGEVICCRVTRYREGEKIEGVSCRLSVNPPPPARGPKPGGRRESADED